MTLKWNESGTGGALILQDCNDELVRIGYYDGMKVNCHVLNINSPKSKAILDLDNQEDPTVKTNNGCIFVGGYDNQANLNQRSAVVEVGGNHYHITAQNNNDTGIVTIGGKNGTIRTNVETDYAGLLAIGGGTEDDGCSISMENRFGAVLLIGPADGSLGVMRFQGANSSYLVMHHASDGIEMCVRPDLGTAYIKIQGKNVVTEDQVQLSHTITHNAPAEESIESYVIGKPCFLSGNVYKYDYTSESWSTQTDSTNCICSVKTEGTYKEFVGIITSIDESKNTITFATHGDFYMWVNDSTKYAIGQTILYNGIVLSDDSPINNKIVKMTVGTITAKIDKHTIAVFKT